MRNYAEKFKEDYKFLEKYGFCFTKDPHNAERPCYKNRYGEIILWINSVSSFIYIQVNGWRKDINIKEDYKTIFKKSTLKPLHVMFKELFVYLVKTTGKFYDLEVIPNDNYKLEEVSVDEFMSDINPLNTKKSNILIWITFGLLFLFIPFIIALQYIKDINVYNGVTVCIFLLMLVFNIFITFSVKKFNVCSLLSMYAYPIMCMYLIYNETRRTDYICYQVYFWISLLYFVVYLFKYLLKHKKEDILSAILVLGFPLIVLIIKAFALQDFMFFEETFNMMFLIVAIILTIISACFYLCFRKDRKQKGYVGAMFGLMICVFFICFITPLFTVNVINYSFDTSTGDVYRYKIVDKYTRHRRKSGVNYYIVIIKDGKEESLSVSAFTYYDLESYIDLYRYDGFLGYQYYEYKGVA